MAMIKIYRVKADLAFWTILPADTTFWEDPNRFRVKSMKEAWTNTPFYVHDPVLTTRGSFFPIMSDCFAYGTEVILSPLGHLLSCCGEALPSTLENPVEDIFVYNPTACYNCLDRENSVLETTMDKKHVIGVKKYAFHVGRVGDCTIFKTPETFKSETLAISGRVSPEEEFYAQYHALGFTGLKFEQVWSGEI